MIDLQKILNVTTESEILEFKEAKNSFELNKLGEYFSALSNEANLKRTDRAYILLGIKNDKTICGTTISDDQVNKYKLEISNNTSPSISFIDVERIQTEQGDVLCFIIPAAPRGIPISWKGFHYGRNGESLGPLDMIELDTIRNQTKNTDWSIQIVDNATIDDLSKEAIDFARIQFAQKNPRLKDDIQTWDDREFLNKARITINDKITNTSILLLGKPESEYLLSPAIAKISWILKDKDGIEKDYEHFTCPFILSIQEVYKKIRNITYRYIKEGSLFPEETPQYEPYTIRESLNNCIAHQEYTNGGKINLVENEDGFLTFKNSGSFIPKTIENVINSNAPESVYRNPFLVNAMVNLNMIDSVGSGIKKMFTIQKNKYFPLPDYDFSNNCVEVKITGKVLDIEYAKKLVFNKDLALSTIILLDKVQKKQKLTDEEFQCLKTEKLIEGRKNNYFISSSVAKITNQEAEYMKLRGIDDDYCKKMILDFLKKFGKAKKSKIEDFLLEKLPDSLDKKQKQTKIKNILQSLKNEGKIQPEGKEWKMSKSN